MFQSMIKSRFGGKLAFAGIETTYRRFKMVSVGERSVKKDLMGGEGVQFPSADGVLLNGRLFRAPQANGRAIVFCHEAGACMGAFEKYAWFLSDRGFDLLTFTFREESASAEAKVRPWVTNREVNDVLGAIRFLRSALHLPEGALGLMGISRGASAAICTAAQESAVGAVLADGGFDTRRMIEEYLRRWNRRYAVARRLPAKINTWSSHALMLLAQWRTEYRFCSVHKAVSRAKHAAFFFIHGEDDRYVPDRHAVELFQRAKSCRARQLWLSRRSGHNDTVAIHRDEYSRHVSQFFEKHLVASRVESAL